jgi:diaminopimelate epimerase
VIRAVRTAAVPEMADQVGAAEWFMDYRNADGSIATMCGNGLRVYVAYLERYGYLALDDGATTTIATRAGTLTVRKELDEYTVDMGIWSAPGGESALAEGFDVTVVLAGLDEPRPGLRIDVPNPHTVIALTDVDVLAAVDLSVPPRVEPEPEDGTNVELVVPLGERAVEVVDEDGQVVGTDRVGVVQMRVHERGVGETLSCGTGACAAAVATRLWFGDDAPNDWVVLVPGGQLRVVMLDGGGIELSGPVELVAEVTLLA